MNPAQERMAEFTHAIAKRRAPWRFTIALQEIRRPMMNSGK
jgi:hypothetical protein